MRPGLPTLSDTKKSRNKKEKGGKEPEKNCYHSFPFTIFPSTNPKAKKFYLARARMTKHPIITAAFLKNAIIKRC